MKSIELAEFEELVGSHQKMVYLYVLALVGEHFLAEDLTQETFVRAYASDPFRRGEIEHIPAWLRTTARHVVYQELRRNRRHPITFIETIGIEIDRLRMTARESNDILRDALRKCSQRLTGKARSVLEMRYGEGISAIEIGKKTGKTQTNINAILSRIRSGLRDCIKMEMEQGT
ncbi:RNA polymerase sigma factor [Planctomycetota bacterium]